ncbi:ABC transporter ATP-binding protein [Peptoniphilus stercorisuis]|uniref:ABC-2 type transport system ATP-binding protein n=1 Tax=Peptoniphilus stercorisuis TaxID=1436965 RepID=A0ABS4KBV6_9FIRM|nr:ABC transporter ATP-binding protein [Peptoniphilus stercorisuis]MBP2025255.1 ABC-2 type transport system ATP-binding protein [Peptoniphilus stercorisuis]
MEKLIECKSITKTFGNIKALNDLDFNLYDGDIYGLVGANGAGKSTLLKILAGHIKESSGEVIILSENGDNHNKVREEMGFLVENPGFYSYMTGKKNLKYQCDLKGINYDSEIEDLAKEFKIDNALNKKVKGYSTGMRQRLGLVASMINRPKILILDEPINGLDPTGIIELRNFILKINKEWNTTIIISSHILNELSLIATRVGFIKDGHMVDELTSEELKERSKMCIKLIVENEDSSKVIAILEEELKITDYKVLSDGEIEIYNDINIIDIQRKLASHDIYPKSISNKENSLEDYYIELMGGNK